MERHSTTKIISRIEEIYEKAKGCKLKDSFFKEMDKDLSYLSKYFKTTKSQAFFIALVFAHNYTGDIVNYISLARYFDCNPMKLLKYNDDFLHLSAIGVLNKQKLRRPGLLNSVVIIEQFAVNDVISKAILQHKAIPEIKKEKTEDIISVLENLADISQKREYGEISTNELFEQAKEVISAYLHFPLIKKINSFNYSIEDEYLYYYLIWETLSGKKTININELLQMIYNNVSQQINSLQLILSGNNVLIKNGLVEIIESAFFDDTKLELSKKSFKILNECGIKLFVNQKPKDNVLFPQDIPNRKLIFNKQEMKQLFLLQDLLNEVKLKRTQKRLSDKNLAKGITVLFYGAPGTGKTEIAKQIAKKTKRSLMKVEISQSKSMWYGESEKTIKRIFTDYRIFAQECDRLPILFFNEADALISKRRAIENSNVAQTENAMQNILLDELENFEGILIATTNLANHLDTAFERRFLFKIEFQKPDVNMRAEIWNLKFPNLKAKDCRLLAGKFDFSGGQIDNIFRKSEIYEIINGKKVGIEDLMLFCEEENMDTDSIKIGFKN